MYRLRKQGAHNGKEYATAVHGYFELFDKKTVTIHKLAEQSSVSVSTIRSAKAGNRITGESARAIAKSLSVNPLTLFMFEKKNTVLSESTILLYLNFVGGVLESAVKRRMIKENPCKYIERPTIETPEQKAFDESVQDKIIAIADQQPMKWRVVIYLLLELGIRRGELCALRWEDFDLENGIVSIRHSLSYTPSTGIFIDTTKTRNIRTLNISDRLIAFLKQYRAEQAALILKFGDDFDNQGYLLTQERGKPINPEEITTYFCKFSKRYGVSVHAHAFRHNIASVMLASNVDAVTTAGVLGHASADTTTKVYAHVIERTKAMAQKGFTDAIYKRTKQA